MPPRRRLLSARGYVISIGLTGGIASGKTLVASLLAERGALVIDADRLGHETYLPGTAAHRRIVETFGPQVIATDGTIDRRALGATVFSDPEARRRLEDIVWPEIRELARRRLEEARAAGTAVAVLEAAILLEAGWDSLVEEVWVVTVEPAVARERLIARNGLSAEQADARISAQLSNDERRLRADVVIDNSGTVPDLEREVEAAWQALQQRGATRG